MIIEDGRIIYDVYRGTEKIGELKYLKPGIDMIKSTCQQTGRDVELYSIVNRYTNTAVWDGFNTRNEIQCSD